MSRELDSCPTFQIVDISVTLLRCLLDQPRFWEFLKEQVSHRQKHIKSMLRGQAILSLLQKASSIPESNKQRATEMAINQLRVADDGLHPCNPRLSERSEGVEKWLLRIYEEIAHQFFPKPQDKRMRL